MEALRDAFGEIPSESQDGALVAEEEEALSSSKE